jgi:glycine cleavage system aminomethyltransferase T
MVEYEALVNRVTMWNVAVERQIRVKGPDAELLQILLLQEMQQKLNQEMENMQFYVMKRVECLMILFY